MEAVLIALNALSKLMANPRTAGRSSRHVQLLAHLVQLIEGGQATAAALREFAARIKAMADAGRNPTDADFAEFTTRLDAALGVLAQAKQRIEDRQQ